MNHNITISLYVVSLFMLISFTFIWCVWGTSYLAPQLCEILIHQIYFNLVFTRLMEKRKKNNGRVYESTQFVSL